MSDLIFYKKSKLEIKSNLLLEYYELVNLIIILSNESIFS